MRRLLVLALLALVALTATASAQLLVKQGSKRDTSAPTVTVSFPVADSSYGSAAWTGGCHPHGVCGTAHDPSGVRSVQVALEQLASGHYWSHGGFNSRTLTFGYGVLGQRGAKTSAWHRWLPQLADGDYLLKVIATDRVGNRTHASDVLELSFTIDTVAPPEPTLATLPQDPSGADASPSFSDQESGVGFRCRLDSGDYAACSSPDALHSLADGAHSFCVVAVDAASNESTAACYSWHVATASAPPEEAAVFSISGQASSPLTPGGPGSPIDLVLSNPHSGPITVDSVTVSISSLSLAPGAKGSCPLAGSFTVSRQFSGPLTLPSGSHSLSQLGLPSSKWPALKMLDNGDQDACRGASLALAYSGSAH